MTPYERIHLVVLSYNRLECLQSLFDHLLLPAAERGVQVTVVDNGSHSSVRQFLSEYASCEHVDIVLADRNGGVAWGRNKGARRSNREFIVYLDDDALISIDALERTVSSFDESPKTGILAFRVIHGVTGDPQNEHGVHERVVGNFHGAGYAVRRALNERVGYLDEACFFGAEEIEFSLRASVAGMETVFVPNVTVRHFSHKRTGKDSVQRRLRWSQNYAMVLFRYFPLCRANLFGLRLLTSYMFSGFRERALGAALIPLAMARGAFRGLRTRNPLDPAGVAYYCDPATRPDIGNVSVTSKICRRLFAPVQTV